MTPESGITPWEIIKVLTFSLFTALAIHYRWLWKRSDEHQDKLANTVTKEYLDTRLEEHKQSIIDEVKRLVTWGVTITGGHIDEQSDYSKNVTKKGESCKLIKEPYGKLKHGYVGRFEDEEEKE